MTTTPKPSGGKLTGFLTFVAAGVATGVAAVGMWRFFGDVLHIDSIYLRAALFAFLEIALLVSAIRARRNLLDDIAYIAERKKTAEQAHREAITPEQRASAAGDLAEAAKLRPSTGVDGWAVWGLALMSGVFSALDGDSFAERLFRIAAPLVAAWLWERGLAAHRRRNRKSRGRINWSMSLERTAVRLGIAEPTDRDVSAVARARRIAQLARASARHHDMPAKNARRRRWSARKVERLAEDAIEHLGLGTDPTVVEDLRSVLAARYGIVAGTSPEAVRNFGPWSSAGTSAPATPELRPEVDAELPPTTSPELPAGTSGRTSAGTSARGSANGSGRTSGSNGRKKAPELPVPPKRRSAEETRKLAADLRVQNPDITQAALARQIGISDRHLRDVLKGDAGDDQERLQVTATPINGTNHRILEPIS